jgi:hypothetical protein
VTPTTQEMRSSLLLEAGTGDTSDTVFVESEAIRKTVETAASVTNVPDTRINTG